MTGDGEPVGDAIVRNHDVGIVSLTGDTATGKLIAANAADSMKHVHLELGGKAPFVVVFDDADMEQVVEWIKIGGYFNSGQDAASARILVGSAAYDALLADLVPAVESIKVGDPFVDEMEIDGLGQLERVTGFVEQAEEAGGKVLTGGKAIEGRRASGTRPRSWPT